MKKNSPIWEFFKSVKLTVVLLLSLAVTSIIGTVVPQNASPEAYFHKYGAFLFRLFDLLDIFDMYRSWWFQLLLILLTINIVVCSIERLSATWKIVFPKNASINRSRFRKLSNNEHLSEKRSPAELEGPYTSVVSKIFAKPTIEKTEEGILIYAEKGRWTRLGVYIVHLSVIFLIAGAMIGSIFGFAGFVSIPEGESANSIRLHRSGEIRKLDFTIQCNDFDLSLYENGAPKEFRSSLTIRENGKSVLNKDIIVNDPLRYKGINIFLSSYGELPPEKPPGRAFSKDEIYLNFLVKASGMVYKRKTEIGKPVDIPEGMGKFTVMEFRESAHFMGQHIGDALVGILSPSGGQPVEVLLPLHFPNFDKMRQGDVVISVAEQKAKTFSMQSNDGKRYYTGLQVTKDPGVWVVYIGFMVMIAGIIITFFLSHQSLLVEVTAKGKQSKVLVAGTANKNRLEMERKVQNIANLLSKT